MYIDITRVLWKGARSFPMRLTDARPLASVHNTGSTLLPGVTRQSLGNPHTPAWRTPGAHRARDNWSVTREKRSSLPPSATFLVGEPTAVPSFALSASRWPSRFRSRDTRLESRVAAGTILLNFQKKLIPLAKMPQPVEAAQVIKVLSIKPRMIGYEITKAAPGRKY